jgi:hypothetical protein
LDAPALPGVVRALSHSKTPVTSRPPRKLNLDIGFGSISVRMVQSDADTGGADTMVQLIRLRASDLMGKTGTS